MKTNLKIGLLTGSIAFLVSIIVSGLMGICGPLVALLAGSIAGLISGRCTVVSARSDAARNGAIAAAIVGAFTLIGQIIGNLIVLVFIQVNHIETMFGKIPELSNGSQNIIYYFSGMGTSCCFGLTGVVLSALAGAAAGYLSARTSSFSPIPLPEEPSNDHD